MSPFIIEIILVILAIFLIQKFNLSQKVTVYLLRGVNIYLPPNDKDFLLMCEIKKGKAKNPNVKGIVRICKPEEYIGRKHDQNSENADIKVFFCITSIVTVLIVEIMKIYRYAYNKYYNIEYDDTEEISNNNIHVGASFVLITITYIIGDFARKAIKLRYISDSAKTFLICFISSFIVIMLCLNIFEGMFNFDEKSICGIIDDRITNILYQASRQDMNYMQETKICSSQLINIFYSIIFSITFAAMFGCCTTISSFDDLLYKMVTQAENINASNGGGEIRSNPIKTVAFYCKIKQVVITFMPLLVIDPLLAGYIIDNNILSNVSYYIILLAPVILEFILGLILIKHYSLIILDQNYIQIMQFSANPDKSNLDYLRLNMNKMNSAYWDNYIYLFSMSVINLIVYLFYINRTDITSKLINYSNDNNSDIKFKSNIMDTMTYFIFLGLVISKAVFTNGHTFYMKNIKKYIY